MYYPYYYDIAVPPPIPSLAILHSQRVIQAIDRQNCILNKQVLQLTRQNVNLRYKILKMNTQIGDNDKQIGYSKYALETRREKQPRRKQQPYRYRTDIKNQEINRSYSFGRIKYDKKIQEKQQPAKNSEKAYTQISYKITPITSQKKNEKRFTYHTTEEKSVDNKREAKTFIQRLHQSNINPQNSNDQSQIIVKRIESQPYQQKTIQKRTEPSSSIKKNNKVYLEEKMKGQQYSPAQKLRTIKKLNQSSIPQSRKSIGKKQYLSIIGNIFDYARTLNKTEQKKQVAETKSNNEKQAVQI